jgi:biotin carboxylase
VRAVHLETAAPPTVGARPDPTTVVVISARVPHIFESLRATLRGRRSRIVSISDETAWDVMLAVDVPIEADLEDWEEVAGRVEALARRGPIDAIITHVESYVPLMAYLNERLGKNRTLSLEAARNCRDKARTRDRLSAAGVPSATFALVEDGAEAVRAAELLDFPVVVKPRDGTAGYAVRLCKTAEDVAAAAAGVLKRAEEEDRLPGILVEEYLDGREFAVQTLSQNGRVEIVSIVEQHLGPPPLFVELGYDYPARLDGGDEAAIADVVRRALEALGLDNWVTHTQVRLTRSGPKIVEVNARVPGGQLLEMTTVTRGIDMMAAAVELALGGPPTTTAPRARAALYRSIVFDRAGLAAFNPSPDLSGLESDVPPLVEFDVSPGDPVLPFVHPDGGVYGRVIVYGDDADVVARDYRRIQDALAIEVVPPSGGGPLGPDTRAVKSCC